MVKIGGYKISDLYPGGYNSLNPNYGSIFTGYRTSVSNLSISTDPRTANILKEFSDKIAPGQKGVELSLITPEILETIPKQHLKEVQRLAKLTGVDVTVHGPLVEASGLSKEGFSEANREMAERKMVSAIEKTHDVSPKNGIVTFHTSSVLPSPEMRKIPEKERKERGITETEEYEKMLAIDQDSGQIVPIKKEEKYYPRLTKEGKVLKKEHGVKEQIEIINDTRWENSLTELIDPIERAGRIINETTPIIQPLLESEEMAKKIQENPNYLDNFPEQKEAFLRFTGAQHQLQDVQTHIQGIFDRAYKYSPEEGKEKLIGMVKTFEDNLKNNPSIKGYSGALQQFRSSLGDLEIGGEKFSPEQFRALPDYAFEKSSQSFGNAAFEAYKKLKDETPIMSIENPPAGMSGFSRGEDLKNLVESSRKQFVKRAVEDEGMSESEAEKQAEKLIGVTWDVGHINQIRQFGFDEKDVIKETERVAPFVKHIHLSDNFGMENVELPMGMGNVPLKQMMEKLGKKGEEAGKIIEAGNWWQHFQTSPVGATFEALGSPIYSMKAGPYFNQFAGMEQGYFQGIGPTLPQINYETFGTSFSRLPSELGGQTQQKAGSRMGGTPME